MTIKIHNYFLIIFTALFIYHATSVYANPKDNDPRITVNQLEVDEAVIKGKDKTLVTDSRALLLPSAEPTIFRITKDVTLEDSIEKVSLTGGKEAPTEKPPGFMYDNCCTSFFSKTLNGSEGYYKSAVAKLLQGDKVSANRLFWSLTRKYPKSRYTGNAYYWVAELSYLWSGEGANIIKKKLDESKRMYEIVIKKFPKSSYVDYACYSLAYIYFKEGNYHKAREFGDKCFTERPESKLTELSLVLSALSSYYIGDFDEYLAKCDQVLANFPETEYAPLLTYYRGYIYYTKEQYDKAKKEFSRFMERGAESEYLAYNLYALGHTNIKLGLNNESIVANEALLKRFSKFDYIDTVLFSLIKDYCVVGNLEMAEKMLNRLEDQTPESPFIDYAHFEIAYRYYLKGDYDGARTRLSRFLKKYPNSGLKEASYFMLAAAEYRLERYLDAINDYNAFIEVSSDKKRTLEAMLNSAYAYSIENLPKDAANALEKVIKQAPTGYGNLNEARYFLGEAFYKLKDYDSAAKAYSLVDVKADYYPRAIYALGWIKFDQQDFTGALEHFNKYLATGTKENLPETFMVIAESYFNLKDYDKSIESLQVISDRYKDSAVTTRANFTHGLVSFKKGEYEKAIEFLSSAVVGSDGKDFGDDLHNWLGWSHFQLGNFDSAAEVFTKLINDYPDSKFTPKAKLKIGDCYFNRGNYIAAIMSYEKIIKEKPGSASAAAADYGIIQILFTQSSFSDFTARSQSFIKSYPDNPLGALVSFQLAEYYSEIEDYPNAARAFQDLAKLHAESDLADDALYKAGRIMFKAKKYADALKDFLLVFNDYPDSNLKNENNYYLANTYFELGKYLESVKHYEIVTQDMPKTDTAKEGFDRSAEAYLKVGDYSGAVNMLVKSAEMFNSDPFDRETFIRIGDILVDNEELDEAISYYEKAIDSEYKGVGVNAQMKIADTYYKMEDYETALPEYLKIIYLYKSEADYVDDAYLRIGHLYNMMGNKEKAKVIYIRLQNESYNEEKIIIAIEKLKDLGVNE